MSDINNEIKRLKEGSPEAFKLIYQEFESPLINHLYRMLGQKEKAEEVFQEVMLTMIEKINFYRYRPDLRYSFKSWLFRLATNKAIDEIRRLKKHQLMTGGEDQVGVEESAIAADFSERLEGLIMQLPTAQRTFLNLRVKEDLSHMEIAAICSCKVNVVKQGLFRARKNLKTLMLAEGIEL